MKRHLLLYLLLAPLFQLSAQTSQGTDFWIASTYPFYSNDTFYIAVASEKPTTAYLEIPRSNYKDSVKLGYNEIKYMNIPTSLRNSYYYYYSSALKKVGDNAIHVYSALPIRAYSFSGGKFYSCGASAVYPTATQPPGGAYYPYKARYYWSGGPSGNYKVFFFTVIGVDDSVTVSFKSNTSSLWNLPPGNQILLRKGQMVRIYTWIQGFDPTLSVTASPGKKIAVYTENFYDYAIVGCFQYDLMYEQILPDNILGTDFILTPFKYHHKGYDYTLTATADNTIVKKDNKTLDTLNTGETYYGRMYSDSSVLITANNPINCWEKNILDTCSTGWGGFFSGPSIMTISTTEQLITDAVVSVPATSSYSENFINIITTNYGKDSMWLDGTQVPPGSFQKILGGSYYLYRDTILKGNHRLTCNFGFISYIYGRGKYGSYAYNASAGLQSLKRYILSKTYKSCDTGRVVRLTSEGDPATNFQWTFNGKSDTGLVAYFQVQKEGIYAVKLKYQLKRNNQWDSVYSTVEVKGQEPMDFIVGNNINICNTFATFTLPKSKLFRYKWNTGDTTNVLTTTASSKFTLIVTNTATGCKFYDTADVNLFAKMTPGFTSSMKLNCPGYPIFLKNTTFFSGADSASSWKWYVDNLPHGTTKNDTVKYAYPGTYNLKLIVYAKSGCKDSASGQIKVGAAPTLISGLYTYDSCYGRASYKFNSRSSLSLGKIVRYQWIFSDGDTTYKKTQALKTFHDSGLYWYQITAFSDAGCSDTTVKKYFRVYSAPGPQFDVTDSSVCLTGNYFAVKNKSVTHGQKVRYEWMWGDGSGETYDEPGTKTYSDTGKYKIRLVAAYLSTGCSDTFDRNVHVLPGPKAALIIDSSNYCLNHNYYAFREISDAKGASVRYATWKWGDGTTTKDSLHFKKTYSKAGNYKVTLYFSTGKGCLDSAKKNVVIYTSPIAKITLADSNICGNKNYFDLGNGSTGPANTKWKWNYGDGNTSTTKIPGKISYSTYGKYKISLIATDPLINCSDTTWRAVNVLKSPKADVRVSDTMVCDTQYSITFTDSTNYGNVTPKRFWEFNGNVTDTSSKLSVAKKFKTAGYQNIFFAGGLLGICADTTQVKVHVKYTKDPVSIVKSPVYICQKAILNLDAKVNQGNNWTYHWDPGNGISYLVKSPQGIVYTDTGKHMIFLQVKDNDNCAYFASDSFTVLAGPKVTISNTDADTQCLSANVYHFKNTLTKAKNPVVFDWVLDESNTSSISTPNAISYKNKGEKDIRLIITDANGCKDTATYKVYANPSPVVTIQGDSMCNGESSLFSSNVGPSGIVISKSEWYLDNTLVSSSNTYNYQSVAPGSFKLKIIVTATGGCKDTSNIADILVWPTPVAHFGVKMQNAIGTGVPVDFLDSSAGVFSWKWYPEIGDKLPSGKQQKYSYLYPHLGPVTAKLVVMNSYGCLDSTTLDFILKSEELAWFPNTFTPDGNGVNDVFKPVGLSAVKSYSLSIYNRWGAKMFETTNPEQGWDGLYSGVQALPGAYVYSVDIVFLTGKRLVINSNFTLLK